MTRTKFLPGKPGRTRSLGAAIHVARRAMRSLGVDVVRYPPRQRDPIAAFLDRYEIRTVLDVGANVGQYARALRDFYRFSGQIVSFEPDPDAFAQLSEATRTDAHWDAREMAVGDETGERELRVSNLSVFNSFLPVSASTVRLEQRSSSERAARVNVTTLDDWWDAHPPETPVLLKIDTQGYEKPVLRGAQRSLSKISGLQLELSLTALYEDQPLIEEILPIVRANGFSPFEFWNGFTDDRTGAVLEMDGLFFRRPD